MKHKVLFSAIALGACVLSAFYFSLPVSADTAQAAEIPEAEEWTYIPSDEDPASAFSGEEPDIAWEVDDPDSSIPQKQKEQEEILSSCSGDETVLNASLPASGSCGSSLFWNLSSAGELTITGTGAMTDYSGESAVSWYAWREAIVSVSLPEGLTSIGAYAFSGCSSLTKIDLPSSLTEIGCCAFDRCSSLTAVRIPDGLVSLAPFTFSECASLTRVQLPEGLTSIGTGAFWDCAGLTSLTLPESLTELGDSVFYGCASLKELNIPSGITALSRSLLFGCSSLSSLTLPEGITELDSFSLACCSSLSSITLPDSLKKIENYVFFEDTALGTVFFGENQVQISDQAFSGTNVKAFCPWSWEELPESSYGGDLVWSYIVLTPSSLKAKTTTEGVSLTWECRGTCRYRIYRAGAGESYQLLAETESCSYTDAAVTAGTTYYYKVLAFVSFPDGTFFISSLSSFAGVKYAPAVKFTQISCGRKGLILRWEKGVGIKSCTVWRKAAGGSWEKLGQTAALSFYDRSAENGISYSYAVSTAESLPAKGTASSLYLASPAISSLTSTASGVKITWEKNSAAEGYELYRKVTSSGAWQRIAVTEGPSSVTYIDSDVKNGGIYYYAVKAVNGNEKSASGPARNILYVKPVFLKALSSPSEGSLSITLAGNPAALSYEIWISKDNSFQEYTTITSPAGQMKNISAAGLVSGRTYYVKARAVKMAGGYTFTSAWSAVKQVTVK